MGSDVTAADGKLLGVLPVGPRNETKTGRATIRGEDPGVDRLAGRFIRPGPATCGVESGDSASRVLPPGNLHLVAGQTRRALQGARDGERLSTEIETTWQFHLRPRPGRVVGPVHAWAVSGFETLCRERGHRRKRSGGGGARRRI